MSRRGAAGGRGGGGVNVFHGGWLVSSDSLTFAALLPARWREQSDRSHCGCGAASEYRHLSGILESGRHTTKSSQPKKAFE